MITFSPTSDLRNPITKPQENTLCSRERLVAPPLQERCVISLSLYLSFFLSWAHKRWSRSSKSYSFIEFQPPAYRFRIYITQTSSPRANTPIYSPPRTMTMSYSTALPPLNAPPAPHTNNSPRPTWGRTNPHPAKQRSQCPNPQVEKIIAEIYAEFIKLHSMDHNMRIELQLRKDVQARLESQLQYQNRCLQAAEKQAFDLRERVSILEVELACQKREHLQ